MNRRRRNKARRRRRAWVRTCVARIIDQTQKAIDSRIQQAADARLIDMETFENDVARFIDSAQRAVALAGRIPLRYIKGSGQHDV
jgi:hypothetical protein